MKQASASPFVPILVWLSLVALLFGNMALTSAPGDGMRYAWDDVQGWDSSSDISPQAQELPVYQLRAPRLAAVQPGRSGVSEHPGRRGVTEQETRSTTTPDHLVHEPMPPGDRLRPIIVEATLNRKIAVPLMLDTGATYTVLTRQTAQDLGISGLERLPKQRFLTPGGPIQAPVTTLKSIRVGSVEVQDVAVAIDIAGHLDIGLLGMTFLRHFKVTVDQAQGQVRFHRR
ncbi:MAG TPA: retropepsin-like aspartic protease [Alphaproteobacteria bacterium]|nr:retropepsin-like aspartic protease [Alphaproteobacteria bacterium]